MRSGRWMWAAASGIAVLYVGSTLLTPLYASYEREFGFSEIVVTEIYAIYAIGNCFQFCISRVIHIFKFV